MNKILDLDNPIFVYYIDISGMSRQQASEQIDIAKSMFIYDNVTIWIVPIQKGDTKIEMVYPGKSIKSDYEPFTITNEFNDKLTDFLNRDI